MIMAVPYSYTHPRDTWSTSDIGKKQTLAFGTKLF